MKLRSVVVACAVVVAAAVLGIGHESQFVFTPEAMHRIANQAISENKGSEDPQGIVDSVRSLLKKEYPDYIIDDSEWLFNNAGGAMGAMVVLHASLSEYVIIFGSPIGTEGHSGRFLSDDYFTILHGEQWAYSPGQLTKEVYEPGSQHLMPKGVAKGYKIPDCGCWALEYARGNILSMMPFGMADLLSSTLDPITFWQTVKVSGGNMFKMLLKGKV
ncbi:ERG2/sigma1 receptor-like protein [Chloropicon primus]|uniref:ERG2/sigma1 receptor-like protein n=1 Tax=Chloropicon primus TaxID=1764295 RepID=A0A5B8MKJ3_9CHLO|nr:ERG2/sigma1 receptor-like protein [Chloropicon primus]UPR00207.1 ERG2/sigma1 receptor-like protein [Chloropicon primus]|mmetsp:Transcript_6667/g.19541  ORF Transcript_6667/g.19541 Transcript_6667/m.19541 type:complete len:216 (+) Transcript_6667:226-873(+)|eukprot:QDZ20996.1 ERG2/sigma1 receptor-like protein [Chloropicon primus]